LSNEICDIALANSFREVINLLSCGRELNDFEAEYNVLFFKKFDFGRGKLIILL